MQKQINSTLSKHSVNAYYVQAKENNYLGKLFQHRMVDLGLISLMLWRKPGLCLETQFATDHTIPFRKDFQINAYHPQSSWKMKTEIFFLTKGAPAGDFVPERQLRAGVRAH